jgi:hypothetical protein
MKIELLLNQVSYSRYAMPDMLDMPGTHRPALARALVALQCFDHAVWAGNDASSSLDTNNEQHQSVAKSQSRV